MSESLLNAAEALELFTKGGSLGKGSEQDDQAILIAKMLFTLSVQVSRVADVLEAVIGEDFADVLHIKVVNHDS